MISLNNNWIFKQTEQIQAVLGIFSNDEYYTKQIEQIQAVLGIFSNDGYYTNTDITLSNEIYMSFRGIESFIRFRK